MSKKSGLLAEIQFHHAKLTRLLSRLQAYGLDQEEWEDVTEAFHETGNWPSDVDSKSNGVAHTESHNMFWIPCEMHHTGNLRLRKIDGLHNGPAFLVERRKS